MKPGGEGGRETAPRAYLLGVDGGGTKTQAWIARNDGSVVGRGEAGSSNVRAIGAATALENLGAAISAAWKESGIEPRAVEEAVFALSGAGRPDVQAQVASWSADRQVAQHLRIVHDGEAALAAVAPDGCGIALIAGTGSVAFGVDGHGATAVAGGWGYWFGDEGSAFWLGQAALRAVAHAADGRGPATCMTDAILERLKIDDPRAMLTALDDMGQVRYAIAQLADAVSSSAEQGDAVAAEIVQQAVDNLAATTVCVADQLSLGERFPLALAGGVLCGSEILRSRLVEVLRSKKLSPDPVQLVPEPVAGCLKIACRVVTSPD